MWDILTGFFLTQAVGRSRVLRTLLSLFIVGGLIAGFIYAATVFKTLGERSDGRHVHASSTH